MAMSNRTIDDTIGDSVTGLRPIYLPVTGVWQDKTCSACKIKPDPSQLFDGTWMAATYKVPSKNISITLSFEGTAVSVFFFLANDPNSKHITCLTKCNFRLDGAIVGNYSHASDQSGNFSYNVPVFNSTTLPAANHTLTIEVTGGQELFIGFDYALYTFDDSFLANNTSGSAPPASSVAISTLPTGSTTDSVLPAISILPTVTHAGTSNNSPAKTKSPLLVVVVCVLGSLLVVQTFFFFFWRQRQVRSHKKNMETPIPFILTVNADVQSGQVDRKHIGRATSNPNRVVQRLPKMPTYVQMLEEVARLPPARQDPDEQPPQYHRFLDHTAPE